MGTPVTSAQWIVTFQRESVTDQRRFSITIANTIPKQVVTGVAAELKRLGYQQIEVVFAVVLP